MMAAGEMGMAMMPGAMGQMRQGKKLKTGDWFCPNCGDHQYARNEQCRQCGTAKPAGNFVAGMKPGDWHCPACGDLQFAKNLECRKCGTPNPDPQASQTQMETAIATRAANTVEKPGDWYCPSCGDMQYARNLQCRKCGTPAPDPEAAKAAAAQAAMKSQSMRQQMKPGDWHCTQCGDLQFAKNMQCRRCNTPNYQAMYLSMMAAQGGGVGMDGMMAAQGGGGCPGSKGMQKGFQQQQQQQQLLQAQQQQLQQMSAMMGQENFAALQVGLAMMGQGQENWTDESWQAGGKGMNKAGRFNPY
jgi:predicted RNA-binding Zn-ribbon protein involved in translation (DUF1610 family)